MGIVVNPTLIDFLACALKCHKLVDVQTFVAQTPIEELYVPVFRRLSGVREVELYAALASPFFQCLRRKLGAVVHRDR
jgi:hypothetical protein